MLEFVSRRWFAIDSKSHRIALAMVAPPPPLALSTGPSPPPPPPPPEALLALSAGPLPGLDFRWRLWWRGRGDSHTRAVAVFAELPNLAVAGRWL